MKQIKKKLPIGIENFAKLQAEDFYYVDKTMLIKELLDNWAEVNLFTRPRRFGKTLNMSMLKAFFELNGDKNCFKGTRISREVYLCEQYMGKFPVIFISLKSISAQTYEKACDMAIQIVNGEARRFQYLLESERLTKYDKDAFKSLLLPDMKESVLCSSLRILSELLEKHHGQKVILLIDEYDVPLAKAFELGYYNSMTLLIRNLFENALKTNDSLKFAVLTGCMRISKESIFTGLNNLKVLSVADVQFDEYFGFTDFEVKEILKYYHQTGQYETVKTWYDGYHFAYRSEDIYNPFSLLNTFDKMKFGSYWFETGTPTYLVKLLQKHHYDLERMTHEETDAQVLNSIDSESTNPIPVIYQSGYLTIKGYDEEFGMYRLGFPNREVEEGFVRFLLPYYANVNKVESPFEIQKFVREVESGDYDSFFRRLQSFFADTTYEVIRDQELHYENVLFIVFKLVGFYAKVEYHTSEGRIDLVLQTDNFIYIMEFKLNGTAEEALQQINDKHYALPFEMDERKLFKIGVNFSAETRNIEKWIVEEK